VPTLLANDGEAIRFFIHSLHHFHDTIASISNHDILPSNEDPILSLREIQLNLQYIGLSPRVVYELFAYTVYKSFPLLQTFSLGSSCNSTSRSSLESCIPDPSPCIKVGIISGNYRSYLSF